MSLMDEERLFEFLKKVTTKEKVIASISSSPFLLAKAGILRWKKYTVGMTEEDKEKVGVF